MQQGARMARIGKNIKMFRDHLDVTQDELATRVNLSSGALIAQYEAGSKAPSLDKAMDIATQLGVSLSQLVGEHPPPGTLTGHVTNHIHGDNQTVYQHVERACLVTDDMEQTLVQMIAQELERHRTELARLFDLSGFVQAVQGAVRDGLREGLAARDGSWRNTD